MSRVKKYALKENGRFVFICVAETPKKHEEKVQQAYWRWRGIQPRGTAAPLDEFLAGYERVEVTLEPRNEMNLTELEQLAKAATEIERLNGLLAQAYTEANTLEESLVGCQTREAKLQAEFENLEIQFAALRWVS